MTDNFHYHSQSILNCSPNSAWIGDTIKLYAKNIDFRKILLDIKNVDPTLLLNDIQSSIITHKWKDSLAFILKGNYQASKFNLDIQFGKKTPLQPYITFTTIDQKVIDHRVPLLENLEKNEFVYGETITWKCKGIYLYYLNQGFLIKSVDGTFNLSFSDFSSWENYHLNLQPGDYYLQLFSIDRFSNTELFTIKAPTITNVSPLEISRYSMVQISGRNLPYSSNYKFTHIYSGRSFILQNWWEQNNDETSKQVTGEDIVGSGNYQLELSFGNKSYKYPGTIVVKDYFKYIKTITGNFWQSSSIGCGFAINNKLYIPQQSGEMSIVDLETGNVRKKQGYYNYDHQPVFLSNRIYMNIYNEEERKSSICSFNDVTEEWDKINVEGLPVNDVPPAIGVFNNYLIAITHGCIYQFDQNWTLLGKIKNSDNYQLGASFICSGNGYLYLFDFYYGNTTVLSTIDWKAVKQIKMPGLYENSLRYVFELHGNMYFCAKPRGSGDGYYDMYKFTAEETFEALNPKKLKFDYYNHFCPDGKGNVYFVNEGYVYKFNP